MIVVQSYGFESGLFFKGPWLRRVHKQSVDVFLAFGNKDAPNVIRLLANLTLLSGCGQVVVVHTTSPSVSSVSGCTALPARNPAPNMSAAATSGSQVMDGTHRRCSGGRRVVV